jgi:hypothetical protein
LTISVFWDVIPVSLIDLKNVSEKCSTPIFRVENTAWRKSDMGLGRGGTGIGRTPFPEIRALFFHALIFYPE